ncbi:unnamed protein product [Effrenium voratum]|nr:unnamed protein product [Effrenium voratum]
MPGFHKVLRGLRGGPGFCEGSGVVRTDAGARLDEIRAQLDAVATEHCQAVMGGAPRPDLAGIPGLLAEVQRLLPDLPSSERAKADMMMGCGWHMLGEDEKALEPLLRAVSSQGLAVSDHLSAILVVMPLLRQRCRWSQLLQAGEKAYDLAGRWVDPVLPFMKGVALSRLNCMEQAADCLEEAIQMKPGLKQAHLEFQQAAAELGDTQRCRRVAQLLVDHGGYWVSSLQRPLHFDPKVRSQPWLVHALEDNFGVICAELEAMERRWGKVGSGHRGNENSRHDAELVTAGEWQEVVLLGDSQECQDNCASCPRTSELLQSFPEVASCAAAKLGESLFSRLLPGTRLRAHCGPTNLRLTCHLGICIPSGCEIICGGEARRWETGRCLVFDDSFEHEVRHEGAEARTVLLVNFWHPDAEMPEWPKDPKEPAA